MLGFVLYLVEIMVNSYITKYNAFGGKAWIHTVLLIHQKKLAKEMIRIIDKALNPFFVFLESINSYVYRIKQ